MTIENKVRIPKQERSMQKKQLIRETSLKLFCKNGYYPTTTNQIAKQANMSIGTLYEYYANKEAILVEILDDYFESFILSEATITKLLSDQIHEPNKRVWLQSIIDILVASHKDSLDFNKELQYLYFSIPQVAEICTKQKARLRAIVYNTLIEIKDDLIVTDLEAAAVIFMDQLDSLIDRVTIYPVGLDSQRIIDEGINAMCRYLFGKTYLNDPL